MQPLVLFSKGKGNSATSLYKPLCILYTARKRLEEMLKFRLNGYVEDVPDLSSRQYGFTRSHSTISGVWKVVNTLIAANE